MIKRQLAILAVALTALLGLPALAATASASPIPAASAVTTAHTSCYPGCKPPQQPSSGGGSSNQGNNNAAPKQSSTPSNQAVLAFTGADVMVTIAVAGLLLAVGLVLMGLTRRRTA